MWPLDRDVESVPHRSNMRLSGWVFSDFVFGNVDLVLSRFDPPEKLPHIVPVQRRDTADTASRNLQSPSVIIHKCISAPTVPTSFFLPSLENKLLEYSGPGAESRHLNTY